MSRTRIRFPDPTRIQDPASRDWASELVRTLVDYVEESRFIDIEAIVTAGTNVTVSADFRAEKIYINSEGGSGGGAFGSGGVLDGGDRMILDGLFDGGERV